MVSWCQGWLAQAGTPPTAHSLQGRPGQRRAPGLSAQMGIGLPGEAGGSGC